MSPDPSVNATGTAADGRRSEKSPIKSRVVVLMNFVAPYQRPVYEALSDRVSRLTVLVSTRMESNRSWTSDVGRLDVRVQRAISLRRRWRHPAGFSESVYLHIPWDALWQLHQLRPDVILSGELGARTLFSALYCLFAKRTVLIVGLGVSDRTEQERGRLRHALRRWLLPRADCVFVNGASGARFAQRYGVHADRIYRVPYVAIPQFAEAGVQPRARGPVRNLLYVGQLTDRKGLLPCVHALNRWAAAHATETVTLRIIGSGPGREALERLPLAGRLTIELLGDQNPLALPAFYAQADAFLFPTLADEWGLVVNEAMASGVPVIGSIHSQAVEELCHEGQTGWLFDPENESSMAAAIERALATSPDDLLTMRGKAREVALALTPEWAADRMVAAMRTATAQRGAS